MEGDNQPFLQPIINFFQRIFDPQREEEKSVIEEVENVHLDLDSSYLERFDSFSLQNQDQLKGRQESFDMLKKAYKSWQEINNPLLMISEPGMGSSSLLHSTISLYPKVEVLEDTLNFYSRQQLINLLKKTLGVEGDFENLDQLASEITEDTVVIFENIERLFLRKVGGFNLLDDFILFVHATKAKIYWILTINRYSYYYLDRVRDFSSNFGSILFLKAVKNELIQEVLDERNVGYTLQYLPPKSKNTNQLKQKSKQEKQEILEKEFYRKLLTFADGNISRALLYWRKSIIRTSGKNIYIRAFEPREMSDLSLEEVLILEAIMQHNSLSANELKEVFRNSSKGSKLAIEKLLEKNAVIYKEYHNSASKEYQINPLYTPVVKSLIRNRLNRNIV